METNNKMREALELASRVIHCAIAADILKGDDAHAAFFACRDALAEPVRNCDVGTVVEQRARMSGFCLTPNLCPCEDCKDCVLTWAQAPYEEGGKNGNE